MRFRRSKGSRCGPKDVPARRARAFAEALESRTLLNAGGGFTGSGITGSYFNNSALTGTPSFTRIDDRIDFNFGTTQSPGGSNSPGYSAVGTSGWSAQWVGQIIPKYSETYTFTVTSEGGARLYVVAAGQSFGSPQISDWTEHTTQAVDTFTDALTAGATYNIELQYVTTSSPSEIRLHWSSPSSPDEAIEPATPVGVNGGTAVDWDPSVIFADAFKESRIDSAVQPGNNQPVPLDANGWPETDAEITVFAGLNVDTSGLYTMTFTGSATVSVSLDPDTITSNTYNSSTNTTTVIWKDNGVFPTSTGNLRLTLTNTKRTASSATNTGVTNISIMRPASPGNMTTSYPAGTLYTSAYESLIDQFSAVRFMDYLATNSPTGDVGGNATVNWTDRLTPADSSQQGIAPASEINYQGQGGAIEYAVELCNETGKDMWINIPSQASDTYVTDLADGLLYGFNSTGGVYTAPTASPAFPPLDSNLKVYVEYSNEVWNAGFTQNSLVQSIAVADVSANNADGQIINYDGIGTGQATTLGQRYWALRTVQISNDFRAVWGNASMISTIRPVFEFQYNDLNNTAGDALGFISDYFDNADGTQHVASPEPVNYYLYGAGGGWYNSVNNDTNSTGAVTIPNNSFETPALSSASSEADPTGASWTFSGTAGIASNNPNYASASVSTTIAGSTTTPSSNGDTAIGVGYAFTVSSTTYVNQLGRWIISGNNEEHTLFLVNSSGTVLAQGDLTTSGQTAGRFAYVSIGTVQLVSGQTYYLISTEPSYDWQGFDAYYPASAGCTETTVAGVTIKGAVSVNMPQGEWQPNLWTGWTVTGSAGSVAGPVDFRYVTTPGTGPVTYVPSTAAGSQGAYIQGTGSILQSLTVPAGVCDVTFNDAEGAVSGSESISVYIDSTLLATVTPSYVYYNFYRTSGGADVTAGTHTLEFVGSGNGTAYIDNVAVETVAAIINSGNQSILSQTEDEVNWAAAYGLKTTGYEGGFEIGGDLSGNNLVAQAANLDPSVQQSTINTVDEYLSAGGNMPMVFTAVGEWWSLAMTSPYGSPDIYSQSTPKLQGYASTESALPPGGSNATAVPGTLTSTNVSLLYSNYTGATYEDNGGDIEKDTGFLSWNTLMPSTGSYTITANTTGAGSANLIVDGNVIGTIASSGTYAATVNLSAGPHTIMVQSTSSNVITVAQIVVTEVGAPASPAITSGTLNGSTATLNWSSVANTTGYVVGYGTLSGDYTNFVNVGNVTTAQVTGLNASGVTYFVVYAYNSAQARSLPSAQLRLAARSTNPTELITFEDQTDTASSTYLGSLVESGISFTGSALQIQDGTSASTAPGNWPSKVLNASSWGSNIVIAGSTGQAFDLYSLDLGQDSSCQSAVLTETDASGGTQTAIVSFPNDADSHTEHLVLDWVDIVSVKITWWTGTGGVGSQHSGSIDNVLVDDAPPTIATAAAASASTVTGTSVNLSVLGADHFGAGTLTYNWAATTLPSGVAAPLFSTNGTNAAQNTTAYVKGAGTYVFTVTIADADGATITATVPVTVTQTLTGITISPAGTTVADGGTVALTAAVTDQFGVPMGTQPSSFTWAMQTTGTGSVNSTGIYTAAGTGTGWATVTASGGGVTGSVSIYYTPGSSLVPNYYAGFPASTGLNLNGGANVSNGALQLTDTNATSEIRSVYYSTKLNDSAFVTDFTFQVANPVEDGFTFIIQNESATALSTSGGGQLGYQYITPSVALKFQLLDTNDVNNIGLFTDGAAPTTIGDPLGADGLSLLSGDLFHAHLSYSGTTLSATLTDTTRPNQPSVTDTFTVNIPSVVGASTAWFGFTADSGGVSWGIPMSQDILSWTYGQPIVSVTPLASTTLSSALQSVTINSTRPIALGLSGLALSENGQSAALGTTPTISTGDGGMAYTISNLAILTGNLGSDVLTVGTTGISDSGGNAPAASAILNWTSNTLTALAGQTIDIAGAAGSIASVTVNSGTPYTINLASLSPIYVNGSAGNDALTLDFTNATPVPGGGITFNGATGDSLSVTGTSGNDAATLGGSVLTFNSSTINLPSVPTLTLNTVAGNDTFTQTSQPTATSVTFNGGTGTDQLNVNAGTYAFTANPEANTASLSVTATGSTANVLFNPTTGTLVQLAGLTLASGATAQVVSLGALRTENNERVLVIGIPGATTAPTLSISASSTLDLTDNDLIDLYGTGATPYTTLRGQIEQSYDTGKWDLPGITSSLAAGNSATYGLGYAEASTLGDTTFDGVTLGGNAVLVKYTLLGDTQLRGSVGIGDYNTVTNNFGSAEDWTRGDFHYGGVVSVGDYDDVLSNYGGAIGPSPQIDLALSTASSTGVSGATAAITTPAITGSLTNKKPVALRAGLDSSAVSAYTSVLSDVNSTGTFTLTASQLATINGKTLSSGKHTLHVQELNAKGKVIASANLSFTIAATKATLAKEKTRSSDGPFAAQGGAA
jgi:hypothetical protein